MIEVLFFGQLTDITQTGSLVCEVFEDTDRLMHHLKERYPGLSRATFRIAVNNQLINAPVPLKPGNSVAVMPPFSGG